MPGIAINVLDPEFYVDPREAYRWLRDEAPARLEIRVLFEEMLRRMPDWQLASPGEPRIVPATFTRAYDQIRITFTPAGP
jgi:hypothetical protein